MNQLVVTINPIKINEASMFVLSCNWQASCLAFAG
jgi:hypothetical protein